MRGPEIPENCVLSQGFRTGFVLVGWFCTIRTGGLYAGDRKKRRIEIYAKYVFFVLCFVLFVLVRGVSVLMDH